jgi:hypothetical protein
MSGGASRDKWSLARSARETAETRHPLMGRIRRLRAVSFVYVRIVELIGIESNSRLECQK